MVACKCRIVGVLTMSEVKVDVDMKVVYNKKEVHRTQARSL